MTTRSWDKQDCGSVELHVSVCTTSPEIHAEEEGQGSAHIYIWKQQASPSDSTLTDQGISRRVSLPCPHQLKSCLMFLTVSTVPVLPDAAQTLLSTAASSQCHSPNVSGPERTKLSRPSVECDRFWFAREQIVQQMSPFANGLSWVHPSMREALAHEASLSFPSQQHSPRLQPKTVL